MYKIEIFTECFSDIFSIVKKGLLCIARVKWRKFPVFQNEVFDCCHIRLQVLDLITE